MLCRGSSVGQEGLCGVLCLLVFRIVRHVYTGTAQVAAGKQHHCPSNTWHWFRRFLVIYRCLDKGAGGIRVGLQNSLACTQPLQRMIEDPAPFLPLGGLSVT